jgi:hypothetical protein
MTTAYIAEIDVEGAVRYAGNSWNISAFPRFYNGKAILLRRLENILRWGGRQKIDESCIRIIKITNLQKGMKDSTAEVLTMQQFRDMPTRPPMTNPDAVYKLQSETGRWIGPGVNGKVWEKGGHLRAAVTNHHGGIKNPRIAGGTVFEIIYEDDGVIPKLVNKIPVEEFYRRSPACNRRAGK